MLPGKVTLQYGNLTRGDHTLLLLSHASLFSL